MTSHSRRSRLILIIEDDPGIRSGLQVSLELDQFEVVAFSQGDDALRWLQAKDSRTPDLILMDLYLPHVDGPGVLDRLRTIDALKSVPVIALTGLPSDHRLLQQCRGVAEVLRKPIDVNSLTEAITRHLPTGSE